jgi:tRNA(Leu) C34 or U34 (ribose-2'-O)-methylase TrmL
MTPHRGFAAIGLHAPKDIHNIGSVLRAAGCYGAAMVASSGKRYSRARTDTLAAYRHLPLLHVEDLFSVIPHDCVPVAVDLLDGAADLTQYQHPPRAFYIFGPEDGTLGKAITDRCRDKVVIPAAYCLNLAMAVNVVLYDRMAKAARRDALPVRAAA